MSDSMFFTEQIQTFVAAHPHEEGWKVYELPEVWVSKRHAFRYLLDFVRDRYPAALTRRMTAKCITENELLRTPTYAHPADPGTDWDLRHDLDSTDWYGLVQLEWRQHPIHVLSFPLYSGNCFTPAYYVATKSNDGLRQLAEELDAYGETRRQVGSRNIFVVNGDNLPIEPVSWDDVLLPSELAEAIRGTVTAFFQSEPCYRALGIPYRRGLLFAGPPGCGKTLTLKAVAYHTTAQVITVLGKADLVDEDIDKVFHYANKYAPSIVFFEDLDKLIQAKDLSLSHFLNMLDGFKTLSGVMIIATANEPERLDPALLHRPSRFDRMWTFP
ncbi:MAG: ATP-binding protein, partial [Nitrospirota bacterium]